MKVLQMHQPSNEKKALPEAVIFDLDGTLVDTAPDLAGALNHCLAQDGHAPFAVSEMRGLVGRGAGALLQRGYTLREGTEPGPARLQALRATFLDYYAAHIADDSAPFEGVEQVISSLKSAGVKLGICTNKPHQMALQLIDHLGWSSDFGNVTGGDILGLKKPDPQHALHVASALEADPKKCVFVGDSEVDYEAALAASMPIILVRFGYSNVAFEDMLQAVQIDHYQDFMMALETLRVRA